MSLAAQQAAMVQALSDRKDERLPRALFNGSPLRVQEGMALYRGNQNAISEKVLGAAFPVMRALVGDEFFTQLAHAFNKKVPSTDGDLHRYGGHFSKFLASFTPVAQYPYFDDVARYEWALHRAYFADRHPPIDRQGLARLNPAQLEQSHFRLNPACTLLQSTWAVSTIWQAHQILADGAPAAEFPEQLNATDFAITIRPQWKVDLLPLTAAAYQFLRCVELGACLGDAVDAALEIDEDFAFPVYLQQWINAAIFCAAES